MSLWLFPINHINRRSPQQRTKKSIPVLRQRTSFCIRHKASYAIEVAVVIPFITAFLVMLLSIFRILQIQCLVDEALIYAGRRTAVESSVVESEELLFLSMEAYFMEALYEEPLIHRYVENGVWGIQLWESRIGNPLLYLKAEYQVKIPVLFWNIGQLEFTSCNTFRRWNTGCYEKNDKDYVYITPTGEVYHASTACRVLDLNIHGINISQISIIRGKNGQKYYECNKCDWENKNGKVYYTDYGSRYHKSLHCSFLKRTIKRILLEEVEERRPCSYCY